MRLWWLCHVLIGLGAATLAPSALAACDAPPDWTPAPAPARPAGPAKLRLAYATDPRLPFFDDAQLHTLLLTVRDTAKRHLGLDLEFVQVQRISHSALDRYLRPDVWEALRQSIHSPSSGPESARRFAEATYEHLRDESGSFETIRDFALPHFPEAAAAANLRDLSDRLVRRHLEGLAEWLALRLPDGTPVVPDTRYREWVYWGALGYGGLPYDVVLTNGIVASAERSGNDVHTMLRGGVSAGTTFYRRGTPLHGYVMASTAWFTDLPAIVTKRGEGRYGAVRGPQLAGTYLAHEIGHLLLRLGHPFGNRACVMRPAEMFSFGRWAAALHASRCQVGSEAAMQPGAASLYYDRRFGDGGACGPRPGG